MPSGAVLDVRGIAQVSHEAAYYIRLLVILVTNLALISSSTL